LGLKANTTSETYLLSTGSPINLEKPEYSVIESFLSENIFIHLNQCIHDEKSTKDNMCTIHFEEALDMDKILFNAS